MRHVLLCATSVTTSLTSNARAGRPRALTIHRRLRRRHHHEGSVRERHPHHAVAELQLLGRLRGDVADVHARGVRERRLQAVVLDDAIDDGRESHRAPRARARHPRPVRVPRQAEHRSALRARLPDAPARLVAQPHGVKTPSREGVPGWRPRDGRDGVIPARRLKQESTVFVPHLVLAVFAAAHDGAVQRGPIARQYHPVVRLPLDRLTSGREGFDVEVFAAPVERRVIRGGPRRAVHGSLALLEGGAEEARATPRLDGAVLADGEDGGAVAVPSNGRRRASVRLDGFFESASARDDLERAVRARRGEDVVGGDAGAGRAGEPLHVRHVTLQVAHLSSKRKGSFVSRRARGEGPPGASSRLSSR